MPTAKEKIPLQYQTSLLKRCVARGLVLSDVLRGNGLTYDHLRYRAHQEIDINQSFGGIENSICPAKSIAAVSFFSGAGGLDIGFERAGFCNIAAIDNNRLFCDTLRANNPGRLVIGPPVFSGDIKNRENIAALLETKLNLSTPFDGVFHGGPPCQPFSIAANQRFAKQDENFKRKGFGDKERGNLLDDYIWFIKKFSPKVFLLENVPGLLEIDGGETLTKSLAQLRGMGYAIPKPAILNAANFGVPQNRRRLIIVGSRTKHCFAMPNNNSAHTPCAAILEGEMSGKENHVTRKHAAESVLRYMELKYGERDHLGRVDRLNPYIPGKTVIAGGVAGGGRSHLHPQTPRTLSVRESARLQTFPDNYIFTGPMARQFTQVGNAVPPLLAFKVAEAISKQLFA